MPSPGHTGSSLEGTIALARMCPGSQSKKVRRSRWPGKLIGMTRSFAGDPANGAQRYGNITITGSTQTRDMSLYSTKHMLTTQTHKHFDSVSLRYTIQGIRNYSVFQPAEPHLPGPLQRGKFLQTSAQALASSSSTNNLGNLPNFQPLSPHRQYLPDDFYSYSIAADRTKHADRSKQAGSAPAVSHRSHLHAPNHP